MLGWSKRSTKYRWLVGQFLRVPPFLTVEGASGCRGKPLLWAPLKKQDLRGVEDTSPAVEEGQIERREP